MRIEEITTTCCNEGVASAAVASMGVAFARRVDSQARRRGLSAGAFTVKAVQSFAERAADEDRRAVLLAMAGTDQPVLIGLRRIIEPTLDIAC